MIEKLLRIIDFILDEINTPKKVLIISMMTFISLTAFIVYTIFTDKVLVESFLEELMIASFEPRIEKVSSLCYQQRLRPASRIIAIQLPYNPELNKVSVNQFILGYIINANKETALKNFNVICGELVKDVFNGDLVHELETLKKEEIKIIDEIQEEIKND